MISYLRVKFSGLQVEAICNAQEDGNENDLKCEQ